VGLMQHWCMEYGILALIAMALGSGVAGGVLAGWGCIRRLLAIEEYLKVKDFNNEARFKELERLYLKAEKREAAEIRWGTKAKKSEQEAQQLLEHVANGGGQPALHPWDPRTWGKP